MSEKDDLVQRLRIPFGVVSVVDAKAMRLAADEIERLEAACKQWALDHGKLAIELAAALTQAAEMREACAKVAAGLYREARSSDDSQTWMIYHCLNTAGNRIASAIRELKVEG